MTKQALLLLFYLSVCANSFGQSPSGDTLRAWLRNAMSLYDKGEHAKSAEMALKCIEVAEKEQVPGIVGKAYYCLARGAFQVQDYEKGRDVCVLGCLEGFEIIRLRRFRFTGDWQVHILCTQGGQEAQQHGDGKKFSSHNK